MSGENESQGKKLQFGMLPVRTTDSPKKTDLGDRTLYEFSVIGAVALADDRQWSPIVLQRSGKLVRLLKPIPAHAEVLSKGRLTDQGIDIRHTLFTIETDAFPESQTLSPLDLYSAVHEMIHLLRTVARQYWIGLAMANEGSVVQGMRTRIESGVATFLGQGSFSAPFVVSPLDEQSWQFLGQLLAMRAFPATAEVMLCDALLEIRRAALLQAILLLGVSCEVATLSFLDELISRKGLSQTKRSKILSEPFKVKLLTRTVELDASAPEASDIPGFPKNWAITVCELYRARNKAAHGGNSTMEENGVQRAVELRDIPKFLFSAEALFAWVSRERIRLNLPRDATATMLPMGYPISAMIVPR